VNLKHFCNEDIRLINQGRRGYYGSTTYYSNTPEEHIAINKCAGQSSMWEFEYLDELRREGQEASHMAAVGMTEREEPPSSRMT
jgi:hypothetical protein